MDVEELVRQQQRQLTALQEQLRRHDEEIRIRRLENEQHFREFAIEAIREFRAILQQLQQAVGDHPAATHDLVGHKIAPQLSALVERFEEWANDAPLMQDDALATITRSLAEIADSQTRVLAIEREQTPAWVRRAAIILLGILSASATGGVSLWWNLSQLGDNLPKLIEMLNKAGF
ncbi:MAG: hypothetical protein H6684_01405 [Deltaproteobacteria bacterium]|nr:hypothetical protein [bacterium]MCB9476817.1 hypothetical protein [Deltaproteobacteria bacterium]MCB9487368.1 hypothetical protein [Deltaproteobacteria bacterium]